ncbi:uncharacterized protein LOC122871790 isoform X2 [Siniperca chuatsi]|uniref:uncharacterized protein LOC122871790 isoform X2 n=1 Tax=Siniperca chuatsi TaxID=119488 RepID=UPI001CE073BF|nr:uncharacterized protein LOC122871790 isoform X2 [Siniperca chuatsi]
MGLCQGKRLVSHYTIEFRPLAADSGWNSPSLFDAFHYGLADPIKDQFASLERSPDLVSPVVTDVEDNMLNVGESLRGKGAPRWFIFLSNRKKKKENTSLYVRLHPRHSQVTADRPQLRRNELTSSCSEQAWITNQAKRAIALGGPRSPGAL